MLPLSKRFVKSVLSGKTVCPRNLKWVRSMLGMFPPKTVYDSDDLTAGALCLSDEELKDLGLTELVTMREEVVTEMKEEKEEEELSREELKEKVAGEEKLEEKMAKE